MSGFLTHIRGTGALRPCALLAPRRLELCLNCSATDVKVNAGPMLAIAVTAPRPRPALQLVKPDGGGPSRTTGDWEIIEGLRAGQASAAVALYDAVEQTVSATLAQVLGAGDRDHDDLCQLSLLRVVDSIVEDKFAGRCSLKTWANVIASRLALDELRRRSRERLVLDREASQDAHHLPGPPSDSPETALQCQQELDELKRALGKMKSTKAEALLLFDVLGHDLEEVARLTNVSVAAAQSRVVRGRQELRQLLQGKETSSHE